MNLTKYISLNLFASIPYFICFFAIYTFFLNDFICKFYPNAYITLKQLDTIYALFTLFTIILLILFMLEKFLRKMFPAMLPAINIKNKFIKNTHKFLFIIGCGVAAFNLIIYILFLIFIFTG